MITLNLTDREAAILYLRFDRLFNGNNVDKVLTGIFAKLEQSLPTCPKEELRFNILSELNISRPAHLRK